MATIIQSFRSAQSLACFRSRFCRKQAGFTTFPGRAVAALIAGLCVFFFFRLSSLEGKPLGRRILLALFPIFGTWTWCNLGFGGAWQIALGFALLGAVGALYFTLVRPRPLVAGAFFALAFGNRTELILTLPVYVYLLSAPLARGNDPSRREGEAMVAGKLASDHRLRGPAPNAWSLDRRIQFRTV